MGTQGASGVNASNTQLRRRRLRYSGTCVLCGTDLARGTEAFHDPSVRTVRCLECPPAATADAASHLIDGGVAGSSARREYLQRHGAREARVKGRFGNFLGGVVMALVDDPQSTRAWERGAVGEEKLAQALAGVTGLRMLHDRRAPATQGNIDHLVIGPAGVFVVDAKNYRGTIRVRDKGGLFRSDLRLYVDGRGRSHLAENMDWQMRAVERALQSAHLEKTPPLTPVLCFVDGEWPMVNPPTSYLGVRLESKRSIKKLVTQPAVLSEAACDTLARVLAHAFPAK